MALGNLSTLSARNTHDLWVESRQFQVELVRSSPTSLTLTISYPAVVSEVDGLVVLLKTSAISVSDYPSDGEQYIASTDFTAPAYVTSTGAHVVGFWSAALSNPLPGVIDAATGRNSFQIQIANTLPNQLYYASVHGASNVLQYYPIGVQSYPLESSRIEKDSSSFTGNIPTLATAPISPTANFVYYDSGLGVVQFWTGAAWIPTRTDTIPTGSYNPGTLGQTYYYTGGSTLEIFDGVKWVTASPLNLQLRQGTIWIPLAKVTSGIELPEAPEVGDFCYDFTLQRGQYWDGTSWVTPNASTTLYVGGPISPAFITSLIAEPEKLSAPFLGQLFYNTTTTQLNIWTGSAWVKANTDQEGTPSTDKIAIGTDGSYDERVRLIQVIKAELGYPAVCVELKEENFNVAIDNSLETYRQLSDAAYRMGYILFTMQENQQVYYLNDPVAKTDRVVSVGKIHRLNILGANSLNWDSNVYFQTFLNQYYSSGYTDILSIHLMHGLSEDFQRIFAGDFTFLWDEPSRELVVTRKIARNEKVILECMMERTEQELILDRWAKQFIQNYAIAECKYILGMIRSKYSSGTPGASGPINLNGEMLISEARQDQTELKEALLNYEYGGLVGKGNLSFLIG